jgi:hypothetical protein
VHRALGVEEGDTLVFEVADSYATLRKRRPTLQVAEEARARYLGEGAPRAITNREAIEEHFAVQRESRAGGVLYMSRGDGTLAETGSNDAESDDADR